MRWSVKRVAKEPFGARREKIRFAIFPVRVDDYWVWLENYRVVWTWTQNAEYIIYMGLYVC